MSDELTGTPVVDKLTAFFQAEADQPIDNAEPKTAEPAPIVEEPASEEPKVEIPDEPKVEEPKPEDTPKEGEPKPEDERPDGEDEPEDADEYPTEEKLLSTLPRSVPKKFIAKAAVWAEGAKANDELRSSLGGEPFIAPLTKIATALQNGGTSTEEFQPLFDGVLEAAGDEGLLTLMHMAVHMGFVNADLWMEQPGTKAFGEQVKQIVDNAVETKYGTTPDRLLSVLQWDKDGSLEKLTPFLDAKFEDDDGDFDENAFLLAAKTLYDEINGVRNNPATRKLAEENLALKRQLEAKPAPEEKGKSEEVDRSFGDYITNTVKTIIPKVVWAKSPLMPLDTDDEKMTGRKERFRNNLLNSIIQHVHSNKAKSSLAIGYRQGSHHTAIYQKSLTAALDEAITAVGPEKVEAESILADLYGNTRNAKLLDKIPAPEAPLAPTPPKEFESVATPKTTAGVQAKLTAAYAALEAR